MDFSKRQADPRRHLVGFTVVVLFHAAIVYALVTGLAKKVVDVVRAPIETKVIEEIKKPPPPPEIVVPPPPKLEAPPPPYIPPPEVQIAVPPPVQPTVTLAPSPTPPPEPVVIAPAPPPPVAAPVAATPPPPAPPPAPPKPASRSLDAACSKVIKPEVPATEYSGKIDLMVKYTIEGGKVTNIEITKESYTPAADRKTKRAVMASLRTAADQFVCSGESGDATQPTTFTLN